MRPASERSYGSRDHDPTWRTGEGPVARGSRMARRGSRGPLAAAALLPALAVAAAAQQGPPVAGDPGRGRAVAEQLCGGCHLTAPNQAGPVVDGVPSFASLARRTDEDILATIEGMKVVPHRAVPTLPLGRQQVRDLAAYIRSLAPPAPATPPTAGPAPR